MNGSMAPRSAAYRKSVTLPLFNHAKAAWAFTRSVDNAHAIMLAEMNLLSRSDAKTILHGMSAVDAALDVAAIKSPEPFEDLFFFLEDRLITEIGEVGGNLHLARSRNDLEATVFRMVLKENMRLAIASFLDLSDIVLAKAKAERATLVVAFTHGQPAQPTTFGHYLAAKIEADVRHLRRMFAAYDDIDACPLGAVAITTTGFPIDRHRVAELLGFSAPLENSYGCIASADYLAAAFQTLRLSMIDIGRLSQDLAMWSNGAVNQIRVSDEFCQISSVMPQKRNPLAIEYIRTRASLVAAQCEAVTQALHNTPFADMVDAEVPTQTAGATAIREFIDVCELATGVVAGLSVDDDVVSELNERSASGATELADGFVRLEELTFRQAHTVTKALAEVAMAENISIQGIDKSIANASFEAVTGRVMHTPWSDHIAGMTPQRSIEVREVFGGPGPGVLNDSLTRYENQLNDMREKLAQKHEAEEAAGRRLQDTVASFLNDGQPKL